MQHGQNIVMGDDELADSVPGNAGYECPVESDRDSRRTGRALFLVIPDLPASHHLGGTLPLYFRAIAIDSLLLLHDAGFLIVVIWTSVGECSHGEYLQALEREIERLFAHRSLPPPPFYHSCDDRIFDDIDNANNRRDALCDTLYRASDELSIDLQRSWVICVLLDSIEAGRMAGCSTVLVDNGNEREWRLSSARTPDLIVAQVGVAVRSLVDSDRVRR